MEALPRPIGLGYGERLRLLREALERGDHRAVEEFSLQEMWDASFLAGVRDEDLDEAMANCVLAGACLLDEDYDALYAPGGTHRGTFENDLSRVFPEWRD